MIFDHQNGIPVGVKWFSTGVMINLSSEKLLMLFLFCGFNNSVFQNIHFLQFSQSQLLLACNM